MNSNGMRLRVIWLPVAIVLAGIPCLPATAQHSHSGGKGKRTGSSHAVTAEEAKAAAARKEQIRRHLASVHSHIHAVKVKINQAKTQEHKITENIGQVQERIDATMASLRKTSHRISVLTSRHVEIVARLTRTQDHLATRRTLLAIRLRENYERRHATYATVLVQSRSVHELLSRGYYVRKVVHFDAELIQSIQSDVKQIETDKKALEAQEAEQRSLERQYEQQKSVFAADMGKKQTLLANVKEVRMQAQDELDELESESAEMTSRIRALSEVLRQRQEALRQEALRRARAGLKPSPAPPEAQLPTVFRGHFIKPVPGRITSGFGMRYHPILHVRKLHTGVDFGAPSGTPIHAAAAGIVLLAGYTRGYGNCIIIDHGGGISTLYGHCSSIGVSEGQSVKQGTVIGRVGATGYATGPHLHFEVRRNGVPVNPL